MVRCAVPCILVISCNIKIFFKYRKGDLKNTHLKKKKEKEKTKMKTAKNKK